MSVTAIIVAAGRGLRAGGDLPKQYRTVAGAPLLRHAVLQLLAHPEITAVRVVINHDDVNLYEAAVAGLAVGEPIAGGATRQASARAGLEALAADPPEIVMIHDAARAFVPDAVIAGLLAACDDPANDGAVPGLAVSASVISCIIGIYASYYLKASTEFPTAIVVGNILEYDHG